MAQPASTFRFPPFYSFPPSFTRQPVPATLQKQSQLWSSLIRDYCRHTQTFWISLADASSLPVFRHAEINRQLSDTDIFYFLGDLVNRGDGMWDANKERCLVFWRKPAEWGEMIYKWVEDTGRNGTIMTIYEIRLGEDSKGQEFYNLDLDLLLRSLSALEANGKAAVFDGEASDNLGVKFL